MAPLRSSRSTRNQEHQVAARSRGALDLDPTEGLPVQKWERVTIRVNQDPTADQSATVNNNSNATTSSAEWTAQFGTSQFPWSEAPLPSFHNQLPTWNQEMLRRARAGNLNTKPSVWDSKMKSWISASEAGKRNDPLKSVHLNNLDQTSNNATIAVDDTAENDDDEDNDDADDDMADDNEDEANEPTRETPGPKRRKHIAPEDRTYEVQRWVQVPIAVAEKTEERRFLADRRTGMPSLYGGTYQNQIFGAMGLTLNGYNGSGLSTTGYDLGDGAGLGAAVNNGGPDQGAATPVRRNMPPKRKKKKGGPGRRKANPVPTEAETETATTGQQQVGTSHAERKTNGADDQDVNMQDGDGSGSDDSEAEGSEEGEIDEGNQNNTQVKSDADLKEDLGGASLDPPPKSTEVESTHEVKSQPTHNHPSIEPEITSTIPEQTNETKSVVDIATLAPPPPAALQLPEETSQSSLPSATSESTAYNVTTAPQVSAEPVVTESFVTLPLLSEIIQQPPSATTQPVAPELVQQEFPTPSSLPVTIPEQPSMIAPQQDQKLQQQQRLAPGLSHAINPTVDAHSISAHTTASSNPIALPSIDSLVTPTPPVQTSAPAPVPPPTSASAVPAISTILNSDPSEITNAPHDSTASQPQAQSSSHEPTSPLDLLGGLEDQVDRDIMRE